MTQAAMDKDTMVAVTPEDERSTAQFFFEMGFGACYAEVMIRNGDQIPFPLTDGLIERQWEISQEAYEDPAELDEMLARTRHQSGRTGAEEALREALAEARDAVAFLDKVKSATMSEQIAVGHDHHDRAEAALRKLAALSQSTAGEDGA